MCYGSISQFVEHSDDLRHHNGIFSPGLTVVDITVKSQQCFTSESFVEEQAKSARLAHIGAKQKPILPPAPFLSIPSHFGLASS